MAKAEILVIEDESEIRELIQFNLEHEGYQVIVARSGEEALAITQNRSPDLILLDLMLPGIDGFDVCRALSSYHIPIVMVTAKTDDADIILGLEMGADDYITKPFSPRILIARIRAVLRRNHKYRNNSSPETMLIDLHGIQIDTSKHIVTIDDTPLTMSVTEFNILEFLMRNPGWVFSRGQIIEAVKGSDYPVTERSVDVQILAIRKKLGDLGRIIETVRGIGYRMIEEL